MSSMKRWPTIPWPTTTTRCLSDMEPLYASRYFRPVKHPLNRTQSVGFVTLHTRSGRLRNTPETSLAALIARRIQLQRFVGAELHVGGERVVFVCILAAGEDGEQCLTGPSQLAHQPQDVRPAVVPRAAMETLDLAQPPFHLRSVTELLAVAEAVGAGDRAVLGHHFAGSVAGSTAALVRIHRAL